MGVILIILYCSLGQFIPSCIKGHVVAFVDNNSPLAVISAISIFVLIKDYSRHTINIFEKLASLSLGGYVFHPFFINLLGKFFNINPSTLPVVVSDCIILVITIIGSLFITWLLRKISFLKKYVL